MRKPWWRSRTLWFNAAVAALAAAEEAAHIIQPVLPGNIYAYGLMLLTIGNAVLRILTTQGVRMR